MRILDDKLSRRQTICALTGFALTLRIRTCGDKDVTHRSDLLSADQVAGLDPDSLATVRVPIGDVTLFIPRNVLAGMFVGPLYCKSGRGVCGKARAPQFAFLYPDFKPIPKLRADEFRILSPARTPELIYAVLVGQDEPARVAAFLSQIDPTMLTQGPYGLMRYRNMPDLLVAKLGTRDRTSVRITRLGNGNNEVECTVRRYVFGNVNFSFSFSITFLPHWEDISQRLLQMLDSWVRR